MKNGKKLESARKREDDAINIYNDFVESILKIKEVGNMVQLEIACDNFNEHEIFSIVKVNKIVDVNPVTQIQQVRVKKSKTSTKKNPTKKKTSPLSKA